MDLNINVKIKLDETPELLNTLTTFCEVVRAVAPLTMTAHTVADIPTSAAPVESRPLQPVPEPAQVIMQQPAAQPVAMQQPAAQPVAMQQPAAQPVPIQHPAPAAAVPTAAPKQYTLPEIQAACGPLMDAGKMNELAEVIKSFGVASLMELPADQYGNLVIKLRALGARL